MVKHKEIADRAGISPEDLNQLLRGKATTNVANRLGVTTEDVDQFIKGFATEAMTNRLRLSAISAVAELACVAGTEGAIGFVIGLLVSAPVTFRVNKHERFDAPWEDVEVVLIEGGMLRNAEQRIVSCEICTPEIADLPFNCVLDVVTNCDPTVTDYVLMEAVRCPQCGATVVENSLVALKEDDSDAREDIPQSRTSPETSPAFRAKLLFRGESFRK